MLALDASKSLKQLNKEVDEERDSFCEKLSNSISDRFPKETIDVNSFLHYLVCGH